MLCRGIWSIGTSVSEEFSASTFRVEELRHVAKMVQVWKRENRIWKLRDTSSLPETWRERVLPKPLQELHVVQTVQTKIARDLWISSWLDLVKTCYFLKGSDRRWRIWCCGNELQALKTVLMHREAKIRNFVDFL